MELIQNRQSYHFSRIESVSDANVNKALFTLYGKLINPLADIEKTISEIRQTEAVIAKTEGHIRISVSYIIGLAFYLFHLITDFQMPLNTLWNPMPIRGR